MKDQNAYNKRPALVTVHLKKLTPDQVRQIDEMIVEVGEYGEVHIIVQRGELRYINKVESFTFRNREDDE